MTPGGVRCLYFVIRTFLGYRLDELIPKIRITLLLRLWRYLLFWMPSRHKGKPLGKRLRLVLQELGSVWIKFGRMLSAYRDLFPLCIASQLALLQDKVVPFDGKLTKQQIEAAMGGLPVEAWFNDSEIRLLASVSIAQAHTMRLKPNGREVVIKVTRPDILPIIKAGLKLIYRLARWIPRSLSDGRCLRPTGVVREYEETLIDELNLLWEPANAIQLRRNFEDSPMFYIPRVYPDYCSEGMMVMERIYGTPASDVATLKKNGTNMELLAERGVQVFLTRVSRDSSFRTDMYPGNIFVSYERPENSKYTSIDCGIIDSLNKEDKRYLAENFIAFFNRDYRKVTELHADFGRVPPDTSVEEFEFAIRTVREPISKKPLAEISFGHVLLSLFNTVRRLSVGVQPQLALLQKTLLHIEGVGRRFYPQLDLWKTVKSFPESWIKDQIGIPTLVRALKEKAPFQVEEMPKLPELVYDSLCQDEYLQHSVDKITRELQSNHVRQGQSRYLLGIGATLILGGTFLLVSQPEWGLVSGWLMAGGLIAWLVS